MDKRDGVQVSGVIGRRERRLGLARALGVCLHLGSAPGLQGERKGRRSRGQGLGYRAVFMLDLIEQSGK